MPKHKIARTTTEHTAGGYIDGPGTVTIHYLHKRPNGLRIVVWEAEKLLKVSVCAIEGNGRTDSFQEHRAVKVLREDVQATVDTWLRDGVKVRREEEI
jgi:hypothetical protein